MIASEIVVKVQLCRTFQENSLANSQVNTANTQTETESRDQWKDAHTHRWWCRWDWAPSVVRWGHWDRTSHDHAPHRRCQTETCQYITASLLFVPTLN